MTGGDLLDAPLASFIGGPVSMFLASADSLGTPDATRVVGADEVILGAQFTSAAGSPFAYAEFVDDMALRMEVAGLAV
jgi:hypothetical protein